MTVLTNVYEASLLGLMTGATASIVGWSPFIGLLTAITDGETGSVTEASYTGYLGRRALSLSTVTQDGSSNAQTSNISLIQFGTNTGASVNIVGAGIWTASSGGELRWVLPASAQTIATNGQPEIIAGALVLRLN